MISLVFINNYEILFKEIIILKYKVNNDKIGGFYVFDFVLEFGGR